MDEVGEVEEVDEERTGWCSALRQRRRGRSSGRAGRSPVRRKKTEANTKKLEPMRSPCSIMYAQGADPLCLALKFSRPRQ